MLIDALKITCLSVSILMALCSLGAKTDKVGSRCVYLAAIFLAGLCALQACS